MIETEDGIIMNIINNNKKHQATTVKLTIMVK